MDKHEQVTKQFVNQIEISASWIKKTTMKTHFKAPKYRPSVANQKNWVRYQGIHMLIISIF